MYNNTIDFNLNSNFKFANSTVFLILISMIKN